MCTCVIDVYFQWNIHILGVFSQCAHLKVFLTAFLNSSTLQK